MSLKVVVAGASGRMGKVVSKAILEDETLTLVGAVDPIGVGEDVGILVGAKGTGIYITRDLAKVLQEKKPDVVVDFTVPEAALANAYLALEARVNVVVGTTGLSEAQLERLTRLSKEQGVGVIVAPNFAVGAVLMMRFAREAAKYFSHVEIIELHHDQKLDAPSGTAFKTAELIREERRVFGLGNPASYERLIGARGGDYAGIRIHSVRLPGLVAHQEVIFGEQGQTLTIRHDSLSRDAFVPGVLLAIKKVSQIKGVVYGLENLL